MTDASAPADFRFDVFISYSRKDAAFARRLEQALKAYAPPRDLPAPQRTLRVFRDESDFVGTEYADALRRNLQVSRTLLVVCSPNAVDSAFVSEEIRLFTELRGREHIVTVLLAGRPNHEVEATPGPAAAFPAALVAVLPIPLANDFRGIDPQRQRLDRDRFENAWFKTLADLYADYGISRAQIEQREKLRQARRRRVVAGVTGSVMIALAGLAVWALLSRQEAVRQRELALSGFLASESINRAGQGFDLRLLLAAQAQATAPTPQAREALMVAMQREPHIVKVQTGHEGEITALAVSADGQRVASADKNGRLLIWPVAPGRAAHVISVAAATSTLTFARAGQALVTGHADGIVRVWDVRGIPTVRRELGSPGRAVTSVALAPADVLIAGYADGSVQSFSLADGQALGASAQQQASVPIVVLRVSGDGREFAAITRDGKLSRGGLADGQATFALRAGEGDEAVGAAIGADLDLYAIGGYGPDVALADARTGQRLGQALPTGGFVLALALQPKSNLLAVGLQGGWIALWNTQTRKKLATAFKDHTTDITALAFSADGALLVSGSRDGRVVLWSLQPIERLLTRREVGPRDATAVGLGGDARDVVAGTGAGRIEFAALDSVGPRRIVEGKHGGAVSAIAVSARGDRAASGDQRGHVLLWDVPRAEVLTPLPARMSGIVALQFSRDARRLLVVERAKGTTLWDTTAQPPSLLLEASGPEPSAAALSPDGRTAIVSGDDRTVRASTLAEGGATSRTLFTNRLSYIASLAFAPAGDAMALGGGMYDGGVLIWDVARDRPKHARLGGGNLVDVTALAFSPDGKRLASADFDGEVSLWDVDTGRLIGQPFRVPPSDRISQLGFAAAGNQLVGLTLAGAALVWNLDPTAWMAMACAIANRDFSADEKRTVLLGLAGPGACAGK